MFPRISEDQANWLVTADATTLRLARYGDDLALRCTQAGLVETDEFGHLRLTAEGARVAQIIRTADEVMMAAAA
jgi:hypothetical protein